MKRPARVIYFFLNNPSSHSRKNITDNKRTDRRLLCSCIMWGSTCVSSSSLKMSHESQFMYRLTHNFIDYVEKWWWRFDPNTSLIPRALCLIIPLRLAFHWAVQQGQTFLISFLAPGMASNSAARWGLLISSPLSGNKWSLQFLRQLDQCKIRHWVLNLRHPVSALRHLPQVFFADPRKIGPIDIFAILQESMRRKRHQLCRFWPHFAMYKRR